MMVEPEQIVCVAMDAAAIGFGLTTIVAVIGLPVQPPLVGIMVNVTVSGTLELLVKVPLILPDPLAAIPVTATVLSLVQLKVVPDILLVNETVAVVPVQTDCVAGVAVAPKEPKFSLIQGSSEQ